MYYFTLFEQKLTSVFVLQAAKIQFAVGLIQFISMASVIGYNVRTLMVKEDKALSKTEKTTVTEMIVIAVCVVFTAVNIYVNHKAQDVQIPDSIEHPGLNYLDPPR